MFLELYELCGPFIEWGVVTAVLVGVGYGMSKLMDIFFTKD